MCCVVGVILCVLEARRRDILRCSDLRSIYGQGGYVRNQRIQDNEDNEERLMRKQASERSDE